MSTAFSTFTLNVVSSKTVDQSEDPVACFCLLQQVGMATVLYDGDADSYTLNM